MSGQFRFVDRPSDVRMTGFSGRVTVSEAQAWVQQQSHVLPAEDVDLGHLIGRVLAKDVVSDVDVPGFARSMMDGFAVQAADTLGASPYNRLPLRMVGTSLPGGQALEVVSAGQAVKIMTGAAMPAGADAVLPVEQAECETAQVYVLAEVSPGKHTSKC